MRQDERAPHDRALRPARLAAYPPGEFVGQESFMRAGEIRTIAEQKVGASAGSIFEAQMMMVSDETILKTIRDRIRDERRASAYVACRVRPG